MGSYGHRNGTKEIVLSIRGVRHSTVLVALRADMTGVDKLSNTLLTVPRAQPPL